MTCFGKSSRKRYSLHLWHILCRLTLKTYRALSKIVCVTDTLVCLIVDRKLPQVEIDAVANFLLYLLTVEVDKLPTQTLLHTFMYRTDRRRMFTKQYSACLRRNHLVDVNCFNITRSYCGARFNSKPSIQIEQCRQLLANEISAISAKVRTNITRIFDSYRSCFQYYRRRVDANCTEVLRRYIADRQLRAVKVVRATMDSMGPLLQALPTLRVIHLVRDPRSVAVSRMKWDPSSRGLYTRQTGKKSHAVAEASLYCNQVVNDIRIRLSLEQKFPGRIMLLRYEDVVANPEQKFYDMYKLLDEAMPAVTLKLMQPMFDEARQRMNLTADLNTSIQTLTNRQIVDHCLKFFDLIGIAPNNSALKRDSI